MTPERKAPKSLAGMWMSFRNKTIPATMDPDNVQAIKLAFYAGLGLMFDEVTKTLPTMSDSAAEQHLNDLSAEFIGFAKREKGKQDAHIPRSH